jgi:hypothetical protein
MKFNRVYHPVHAWEEAAHGMWSDVVDRPDWISKAILFTGDAALYGSYMMRVIAEWPISCENALTDSALNQRAWVGHAACALAIGCPEDITREAWGKLTDEQRFLANKEADRAIRTWRHAYAKDKGIHENMGGSLLL